MRIYKILRATEWAELKTKGVTQGAPTDMTDGFVHFSTADQVRETAARHFSGQDNLILLALEADTLGPPLKWEISRGGAKFPHLYGPLRLADVIWSARLSWADNAHVFPNLDDV